MSLYLNLIIVILMCMEENLSGFSRLTKLDPDEYYYSPEGYVVFTEKYLLKRGYCCQNACRHCPYGFLKSKGISNTKNKNNGNQSN